MKIYCITPLYNSNIEYLKQNIDSIQEQSQEVNHILVFDGPNDSVKAWVREYALKKNNIEIIELPEPHGDYGDTPRFIGTVSAFGRGADAVFWLDDDNWVDQDHVKVMSSNLNEKCPIATCQRKITTLEGEVMGLCFETNPNSFIDTNCYMIHKSAKRIANVWWLMPDNLHIFGDKVLYKNIQDHKMNSEYYSEPTVNYRTNFNFHYQAYGYPVPEGAKDGVGVQYANREK